MTLTQEELRKLIVPLLAAMLFIGAGVFSFPARGKPARAPRRSSSRRRASARQNADRLARIAEEEREVTEKLDVYKQLKRLNIPARSGARVGRRRGAHPQPARAARPDLSRGPAKAGEVAARPGTIDFFASTMHVQLDLLHEGDLLRFLGDLRDSGNAYYAVKSCSMRRTGQAATGATITPRLRGSCEIDLITVVDRGAKR